MGEEWRSSKAWRRRRGEGEKGRGMKWRREKGNAEGRRGRNGKIKGTGGSHVM